MYTILNMCDKYHCFVRNTFQIFEIAKNLEWAIVDLELVSNRLFDFKTRHQSDHNRILHDFIRIVVSMNCSEYWLKFLLQPGEEWEDKRTV